MIRYESKGLEEVLLKAENLGCEQDEESNIVIRGDKIVFIHIGPIEGEWINAGFLTGSEAEWEIYLTDNEQDTLIEHGINPRHVKWIEDKNTHYPSGEQWLRQRLKLELFKPSLWTHALKIECGFEMLNE